MIYRHQLPAFKDSSAIASLTSLIVPPLYVGLLGLVPIAIGTKKLCQPKRDRKDEKLHGVSTSTVHVKSLVVAAVTMANGGDNIAVWAALFASCGGFEVGRIGVVFAVMTGLWCFAAHWLVNHRAFGAPIRHRAQQVVPFVLIGLGILIQPDRRSRVSRRAGPRDDRCKPNHSKAAVS